MRNTTIGLGFVSFSGYGLGFWTAPFFARLHGLDPAQTGFLIGGAMAAGGWIGVTLGGGLGDRWQRAAPSGRLRVALLNAALCLPLGLAMLWAGGTAAALGLAFVLNVAASLWLGPGLATIQDLVLPRLRGLAAAAFLLVNALLGLGLGPYTMGRLSEAFGDLRIGVSLGLLGYVVGAVFLLRAMQALPAGAGAAR
jgi:hypothetical protein